MTEEIAADGGLATLFKEMDANPPAQEEPQETEYSEPVESQQENAEPAEEEPAAESEAPDEVEEAEGEAETPEPEAPKAEVTTVDVNGEKLTLDELKQGYMRHSDYSKKTQELAQAGIAEIEQTKQQQLQLLEGTKRLIEQFNPLRAVEAQIKEAREIGDETGELRLIMQYEKLQAQVGNIFNAVQYEQQKAEAKNEAERQGYMEEQRKQLFSKLPEMQTEKGRSEFQERVYNTAKELGWNEGELAGLKKYDHRDAIAYHYAGLYLESLKTKPQAAEKLKGKAVAPTAGVRKGTVNKLDGALQQFRKNPNEEGSLASLFKSM